MVGEISFEDPEMTERYRPVYCTRCGSIVEAGDNFCGVCGMRVSPDARDAAPARQIPTQVQAPPGASSGGNRALPLILGLGAVLVLLLGIGAIVGLALTGGDETDAPRSPADGQANEPAPQPTTGGYQPPPELGVGDSVGVGGVEATLNGVRILPTSDLDRPIQNPDNRFLATDLTFENASDGPVSVSGLLGFVLKNEEGYSASQTVHTRQKELAEGEIPPGRKASGEIVYEVPPNSRGLQLDYRPFAGGATHTWTIGDLSGVAVAPRPEGPEPTTEPEPTIEETTASVPAAEVVDAAEGYYLAVDREDWAYTYANLDDSTRALYTEEEWYQKNQYVADTEGLELSFIDVTVESPISETEVGVTVFRTFKDGSAIDRYTRFVLEGGTWKHRFTDEENAIFEPGVPYEDFVSGGSASASAESESSASAAADGDVDCDEVSQEQARAILERDDSDPNDLDGDGNGLACDG
jgi:hypothetical protein